MADRSTSRRGRRLLLVLATLAVAGRLALPVAVRWLVLRQAAMLAARIAIDDVDLSLWRARLTLSGVAIRDRTPPRDGSDEPSLQCRQVSVSWRWRPLLQRRIEIDELALDGPRAMLDRFADGTLNLAALLPATPSGATAAPSPWSIAIERLRLADGGVRFRDLAVPSGPPVEATVDRIDVAHLAFAPGASGHPTRVHLDLAVDDGRFGLAARVTVRPGGVAIAATARGARLPLSRVRLYAPSLGWSDLAGQWGGTFHYRYEPAGAHTLRGRLAVDDVAVHVPQRSAPALSVRNLTATLDPLDFAHRRMTLSTVAVRGAALPVAPASATPVPLLAASPPAPATPTAAAPWAITVAALTVADSTLLVADAPGTVAIEAAARDLVFAGARRSPLQVAVRAGDATTRFDGTVRLDRFDLAGTLAVRRASLPALARALDALPPDVLQVGRADADLQVELDGTTGDARVSGPLTIDDLWIAAEDPHECSLGARRIRARLDGTRLGGSSLALRVGELDLDAPYAELVRAADGRLAPPAAVGSTANTAPTPEIALDLAHATGARLYVTDRTVAPFFLGGLDPFELELQQLRWPAGTLDYLGLDGRTPERGRLQARGWLVPAGNQIEVEATDVALLPLNPYVAGYSSYSVARGRVSGTGTAWFGPWGWDGRSHLVLHDFDLANSAGESLFRERYGLSLSVALPLLRDLHGDIALDVPVSVDAAGTRVGVSTVVTGAIERALVNTLSAPAKLIATILPSRGGDEPVAAPTPIAFQVGRSTPTADTADQVRRLGAFVVARPGLTLRLGADPTEADARWLALRALRQRLASGQRMDRDTDTPAAARIRAALDDWQGGGKSVLDSGDEAILDRWVAAHAPSTTTLQALAADRLEYVRAALERRFGLQRDRVAVRPAGAAVVAGAPAVQLEFGAPG